jgi:hypothetical protein
MFRTGVDPSVTPTVEMSFDPSSQLDPAQSPIELTLQRDETVTDVVANAIRTSR